MRIMSYKALLFCPDEKTARVVTQVLSELEFTVERSSEPLATVKKLSDEHFDALVVDCQNEEDASLLFKGARASTFNHSSLSVAVVEGQAGVAKAFRIGANLVLTKPINVEQSKSTLRVARGLLRKNEAKPAIAASAEVAKTPHEGVVSAAKTIPFPPFAGKEPLGAMPFASLDREEEPAAALEPADTAVLESLPVPINPTISGEQHWAPKWKPPGQATSAGGQSGAAVAPALSKPLVELKAADPLAMHEPIVANASLPPSAISDPTPTFSSYAQTSNSGGSKKIVIIAVILVAAGVLGYIGLQQPQLWRNLHPSAAGQAKHTPETPSVAPVSESDNSAVTRSSAGNVGEVGPSSAIRATRQDDSRPQTIEIEEAPTQSEPKITVVAKPLLVTNNSGAPIAQKSELPAPPGLEMSSANNSTALAGIVSTDAVIPSATPRSVRISQGVSQGLILKRVAPAYPANALQLRKQGAVELLATINKDGAIAGIKVISGDLILAKSATDAVRQWKYRPYLLNGEPVEIETQLTINFTLPR